MELDVPAAAEIVFGTPVVADAATPTVPTVEAPVNVVAPDTSGHAPTPGAPLLGPPERLSRHLT